MSFQFVMDLLCRWTDALKNDCNSDPEVEDRCIYSGPLGEEWWGSRYLFGILQ